MSTLRWVVTLSPKSFPLLTERPWLKVVKLQIRGAVGVGVQFCTAKSLFKVSQKKYGKARGGAKLRRVIR